MADTHGTEASTPTGFLTEADEMSLAESQARQAPDSEPDTLEVRDDSLAILQGEVAAWRRPVLITLAVVAVGLVAFLGGGLLTRRGRVAYWHASGQSWGSGWRSSPPRLPARLQ